MYTTVRRRSREIQIGNTNYSSILWYFKFFIMIIIFHRINISMQFFRRDSRI